MTENTPSPVFQDRIAPTEAPAAIGSRTLDTAVQKQQAVISKLQERAEKWLH